MNRVFTAKLAGKDGLHCELDLPATPYQMLDALEKLRMSPGDTPRWRICEFYGFKYLAPFLDGECSIYELNALSAKLTELDDWHGTAFEGLLQIDINKKEGDILVPRLIDLAYSTDCCHVIGEARDDSQLGYFYAANGFIPATETVPDSIFEMLDFEMVGRKFRMAEHGVYTSHGYVVQNGDLNQVFDTLDLTLKDPTYIFRCVLNNCLYDEENPVRLNIPLDLPATEEELNTALEKLGAPDCGSAVLRAKDSAVPYILDDVDWSIDGIDDINKLAQAIRCRKERDELPKLKAVLHATDCYDVNAAISIAENLDDYLYEPTERSAEEVATEELRFIVDERALSILQRHVNLFRYGEELISAHHAAMTPYGLVERRDGEPIQGMAHQPQQGGMEMK